jgi:hypothetical protein
VSAAIPRLAARLALLAALLLPAPPASAVIIASGDGTGNTSAPPDDPGWDYAGSRGVSYVYLGNGWVLTATHVVTQDFQVNAGSKWLCPVDGTEHVFHNSDGTETDLKAFRVTGYVEGDTFHCKNPGWPDLPPLALVDSPPPPDSDLVLIGHGRDRGDPVANGWLWANTKTTRWGTNLLDGYWLGLQDPQGRPNDYFSTSFTEHGPQVTEHESQAANGDSGGAVFVDTGSGWALAGIMSTVTTSGAALWGDLTFAVSIGHYVDEVLEVVRPCQDGTDNDGDGKVDLDDPGCHGDAFAVSELPDCDDGMDNDGDGLVDYQGGAGDPGCRNRTEFAREDPECLDGKDNDGDGFIDYPADPGCAEVWSNDESPACDDDVDNDLDGDVDFPADQQCANAADFSEEPTCGLGGEVVVLALLVALRRRAPPRPARSSAQQMGA